MKPRDYQLACNEAVVESIFDGHKATLVDLFTGAGKTVNFALHAKAFVGSSVLVICHQRELVRQAARTLHAWTGEDVGIEMAEQEHINQRLAVACRDTLIRGRYKRFLGRRIIIVDEAHLQMSEPFLMMLREFQNAGGFVIGCTATPFRMDKRKLMDFYDNHAFSMSFMEGIREGWCCPPLAKLVRCKDLSLKNVRVQGGDFSASDLDVILGCSKPLHQMCVTVKKERVGPAIAFLPGVKSAVELALLARRDYGIRAEFICADKNLQSEEERAEVVERYRNGDVDLLTNCQIAAVGFDAPITQSIFMFRPTKSRVLALQIWGRAMRPLPGVVDGPETAEARKAAIAASAKTHFKIIDMTDSTADHSLITAVDMFATDDTPQEVRAAARKRAEKEEAAPDELLVQAAEDVRKAQMIEEGLRLLRGEASGSVVGKEVDISGKGRKCVSDYRCPLKGAHHGRRMGDLDDGYIRQQCGNRAIQSWQRSFFIKERSRRLALERNEAGNRQPVPS